MPGAKEGFLEEVAIQPETDKAQPTVWAGFQWRNDYAEAVRYDAVAS